MMAWDPVQRRKVWTIPEEFPLSSGAAVTAGNIVFYGTLEGWFKAMDAQSGKLLWQFKTGSGIVGQPTVYRGPDGHEYVAILSGIGGWPDRSYRTILTRATPRPAMDGAVSMGR